MTQLAPYLVGASQVHQANDSSWAPIATAPRDGTVIELKCTYGVAPWYGLYRWTDESPFADRYPDMKSKPRWAQVSDLRMSVEEGPYLFWRPYVGAVNCYRDPTNGAQDDSAYWRGAVAAKHGLPPDVFEKTPEPPPSLWQRIFGKRA